MIRATFRPIDQWPGALRSERTSSGRFKASYSDTLDLLEREIDMLDGHDIVIQLALDESDIRNDGWPRSNARPRHPGVIVSFESKQGPLTFATDVFDAAYYGDLVGWQANLRAIALGLEALRKVDRYGITKSGEQYRGWKALGAGEPIALGGASMSTEEAIVFIGTHAGLTPAEVRYSIETAYRLAAKGLHPDTGGDPELFKRLQEAKAVLDQAAQS